MDVSQRIKETVNSNRVMLFMKGNRDFPQCGFSGRAIQILQALGAQFETADVLTDDQIRQGIKEYSNWPTIPQLYIGGEFVGGSDIMMEMYENGELKKKLSEAPSA
jgi:monothiol glutaredoxin